jgi:hypothetical protein
MCFLDWCISKKDHDDNDENTNTNAYNKDFDDIIEQFEIVRRNATIRKNRIIRDTINKYKWKDDMQMPKPQITPLLQNRW